MSLVEKLSNENSQVCSIVVIIPVTIKSSGAIFGRWCWQNLAKSSGLFGSWNLLTWISESYENKDWLKRKINNQID